MDREEYFAAWALAHGGVDPAASGLLRCWLGWCYRLALRLRSVPPGALTLAGLGCAAAVPAVSVVGGRFAVLAASLAAAAGVADNLDGAVAVIAGRVSLLGGVLDSLADRLADTAYALALWALGAPGWLAGLVAGIGALLEYVRARALGAGMSEVGVLSVWERPTRVLMTVGLLLGAGLLTSAASVIVTAGAAASLILGCIGTAQVLLAVRRSLR